jgi:hypothetical protein
VGEAKGSVVLVRAVVEAYQRPEMTFPKHGACERLKDGGRPVHVSGAERATGWEGLARPGPARLDQGDDAKDEQQQEAEQKGRKEGVTNGTKNLVVISNAVVRVTQRERDQEEHHDYDGDTEQNPAANNHLLSLMELCIASD